MNAFVEDSMFLEEARAGSADGSWAQVAESSFRCLLGALRNMPVDEAIPLGAGFRSQLSGVEAQLLASRKAAGASDRSNETAVGRGTTTSKHEAKKRVERGNLTEQNPTLGGDVADGAMTEPQLDAIGFASRHTEGAAANDQPFIERIKQANPDQAMALARTYIADWETRNKVESRHERQRRNRNAKRRLDRDGLDTITLAGDNTTIANMWKAAKVRAEEMYRADGGRDLPDAKHPRSYQQRLYDAFVELTTSPPRSTAQGKTSSSPRSGRATVTHVHLHVDEIAEGELIGRTSGGEVLPRAVLDRYLCNSDLVGTVFGTKGQVLWHGRTIRFATPAQVLALTARDQGCVLCRAEPGRCQAHHVIPSTSPKRGPTDIDNLVFVCTDCHHHIHGNQLTLYQQLGPPDARGRPTVTWKTRPATEAEIPAIGGPPPRRSEGEKAHAEPLTGVPRHGPPAERAPR